MIWAWIGPQSKGEGGDQDSDWVRLDGGGYTNTAHKCSPMKEMGDRGPDRAPIDGRGVPTNAACKYSIIEPLPRFRRPLWGVFMVTSGHSAVVTLPYGLGHQKASYQVDVARVVARAVPQLEKTPWHLWVANCSATVAPPIEVQKRLQKKLMS